MGPSSWLSGGGGESSPAFPLKQFKQSSTRLSMGSESSGSRDRTLYSLQIYQPRGLGIFSIFMGTGMFLRINWDSPSLPGEDEPYNQEEVEPLDERDSRHG
jgi:hypothetical protein